MGCTPFSIPLPVAPTPSMFERVRQEIVNRGGRVWGDLNGGSLFVSTPVGSMSGDYLIQGANLVVTVVDKPLVLSCARIEQELRAIISRIPPDVIDTYAEPVRTTQTPRTSQPTIDPVHVRTTVTSYDFTDAEVVAVDRQPPSLWPLLLFGVLGVFMWWRY